MTNAYVSLTSAVDQFRDAIAALGITPPDTIEADGRLHRFSSNGKRGNDAGWYIFRNDDIAAGSFGDFRTGLKVKSWVADIGRPLTVTEKDAFKKKQETLSVERQIKKEQLQNEARAKAYGISRASIPADTSHPYLAKKNVGAHGISVWEAPNVSVRHDEENNKDYLQIRSNDGALRIGFSIDMEDKTEKEICKDWESILLIPMIDQTSSVQSFQFISKSGNKKFLYGGKMQGCYFPLGKLGQSDKILIAEGYATAATIHEITGHPVIVAYNAGNLMAVAKSIRAQHPSTSIILCADDDIKTKDNPGVTKATEAAQAIGGKVIIPDFGDKRPDGATDFNDMEAHLGKDAVTSFFTGQFSDMGIGDTNRIPDEPDDEPSTFISKPANMNTPHVAKAYSISPFILPVRDPIVVPKTHFSPDEFPLISRIWKTVPYKTARHTGIKAKNRSSMKRS